MKLLRAPISRLCFSPYVSTAAMLDATSGRSLRFLPDSGPRANL
jgi:hypothetical protein